MWGWLVQSGRSCLGFPVRRVLLYQSLKMIKNKTDLSIKHAGLEKLSGPVGDGRCHLLESVYGPCG
jgi:hypothetical protein